MSYQGQNPNADEYGRGYTPQPQPADPYTANSGQAQNAQSGNQYYQPGNNPQTGNQYYQPGNNPQYQQQQPNYGQPPYNQQQWGTPQGSPLTTLGIDPKIEAVLCYAFVWVSGLIIFFLEKQNRQVRFHAMQSIIVFGGLSILMLIVGWLPFINVLLLPFLWLVYVAAWIGLMVLAYTNNPLRIPYISDYADRFTNQIKV